MDATHLLHLALQGDRHALARLLRTVEDHRVGWQAALGGAWERAGRAHLIGVTGAPGSGKSTLTNSLISAWRRHSRAVAVVAVDPSSPFSGGALLGDRIRMQTHIEDPDVFVRSMSSRGRLGGVADTTAGLVTILDAAHFDPVVVETVGVGQSEVDVIDHSDTVVVVVTPGWGDDVQTDKAGLLEIGDVFVINKADRRGVARTRRNLATMLEMGAATEWTPPIVETVATSGSGTEELIDALDRHRRFLIASDEGSRRQRRRGRAYTEHALSRRLRQRLALPDVGEVLDRVVDRSLDPWSAAEMIGVGPPSLGV